MRTTTQPDSHTPPMVHIAPTLETMARVYALSRDGGNKSERFAAYVALTPTNFGLVPYNPMAGEAALETVRQLLAMNAESLAKESAQRALTLCEYAHPITLAVSVRSKGLWTDRTGTEVDERATGKERVRDQGVINIWSREDNTKDDVERESVAEAVRVMWHALHGTADTLRRVLHCEGLAYALHPQSDTFRPNAPLAQDEEVLVVEALDILGDSRQPGDITGVLYGDDVAEQLGYIPLGLPAMLGYRWAVQRARHRLAECGAPELLRMSTF